MKGAVGAFVMAALLAFYLALVGWRAWLFFAAGTAAGVGIGSALLVMMAVGAWALGREVWFGFRVNGLIRALGEAGGLPVDDLPRLPSGRVVRSAADAEFERYRAEAEGAPDDWRSWLRLGLAYDASGDRRRARAAMRRAIVLNGVERRLATGH